MIYHSCFPKIPISIGALPSSYDETLSYLELLELLRKKIDDICKYLQDFSIENIDKLIEEKFEELKNYVDLQDNMLYNYIDNQIKDTKNYTDIEINKLNNQLVNLLNQKVIFLMDYVNNTNDILKNQLLQEIQEIKDELDNIIIKGISVFDPTTGQLSNIQEVVYNLYKYLRYYGIKAIEFDGLGLSCQDFDNKQITARNFDLFSKDILLINFFHYMYSPFNGQITLITDVINQLANYHKSGITASKFDDLNLSAETFDNKNLSAYDFDFNSENLLVA